MNRTAITGCLVAALLLLGGCGDSSPGTTDPGDQDWDGAWVLRSGTYDGRELPLLDTHPVTLVLDGHQAYGISACNHYGGTVTRHDDEVSFGELGGTDMACMPRSAMDLERDYLTALAGITAADRTGDSLVLSGNGTTLTFAFEPPPPTADLVGTTWVLESLITGDSASSVAGHPTLLLRADGTVSGSTGCRTFEGTWVERGAQLDFVEFGMGDETCSPALTPQDSHVVVVLGDGFTAAVDGPTLTVSDPDGNALVYRAQDSSPEPPAG